MALVYLTGGYVMSRKGGGVSRCVVLPGRGFEPTDSDGRPWFLPDPRAIAAIHDRQGEG